MSRKKTTYLHTPTILYGPAQWHSGVNSRKPETFEQPVPHVRRNVCSAINHVLRRKSTI